MCVLGWQSCFQCHLDMYVYWHFSSEYLSLSSTWLPMCQLFRLQQLKRGITGSVLTSVFVLCLHMKRAWPPSNPVTFWNGLPLTCFREKSLQDCKMPGVMVKKGIWKIEESCFMWGQGSLASSCQFRGFHFKIIANANRSSLIAAKSWGSRMEARWNEQKNINTLNIH